MPLQPPVLSEFDPLLEAEGSIDPLGLQAIYERLADRVLPAVTVRMRRPRFLTAMAVGARVCDGFDREQLAADGVTPPWLVFEWLVVEAIVRRRDLLTDVQGTPGVSKVANALRDFGHLNAGSYLKTPKVFGFSGVYKRLAVAAQVLTDDLDLDDAGHELVKAWEEDQHLEGFSSGRDGEGANLRARMRRAVVQGMDVGHTTSQSTDFWETLAARLEPGRPGRRERAVLFDIIRAGNRKGSATQEIVDALMSRGKVVSRLDEQTFIRDAMRHVGPDLRAALEAVDAYESLCRPISDAFERVLQISTAAHRGSIGPDDFVASKGARPLFEKAIKGIDRVVTCQQLVDWESADIQPLIDALRGIKTPEDLFAAVVERHEAAQKAKPPNGKRPWIERTGPDKVIVRAAYARGSVEGELSAYVHEYRTPSLSGFLRDVGKLS